jgi:integrase
MPRVALTDRWIRTVRVAQRTDFFDVALPTFGVRIAPTGHRSWFVLYSLRGERRKRRLALGTYPAIPLSEARRDALTAIASVVRGEDPKLATEVGGITFGDLARLYMERESKPKKRSWKRDQQAVDRDLVPAWDRKPAAAIRRREVVALLDSIMDRKAPMQANYVRSVLSCIYRFGISRDLVDFNPVSGTDRPHDPVRRDRVLSDAEIVQLWRHTAGLHASVRDALRGILLSAQRPGEVAGMVRGEVGEGAWTIPVARAKRRREHVVPLVGMFAEVVAMAGDPVLFPSAHPKRRGLPITREALSYSLLHFRRKAGWRLPATPHDLRRTAATGMAQVGVPRHVIGRVLGHTDSGPTAIYDRWEYFAEKREALEKWDAHLRKLLSSAPSPAAGSIS